MILKSILIDDERNNLDYLRNLITENCPEVEVSACATDADEGKKKILQYDPDLVFLDINMPGRSGLDVLKDVKREYPRVPVIILSMQPEDQYAMRCLRAGASAYMNKDSAPEELAQAIKKILAGGRYVSPSLAEQLVTQFDKPAEKPLHELLSDREYEVMRMIASGVSLTEIAVRLNVSVKTISTYRARIMEKMQIKSNAEVTRYALTNQLID